MSTRLMILVRHGKYTPPSHALSPAGVQQIKEIGEYLSGKKGAYKVIVSSTGPRSLQSAELLSKRLGLAIEVNSEIILKSGEQFSPAVFETLPRRGIVVSNGKFLVAVAAFASKLLEVECPVGSQLKKGVSGVLDIDIENSTITWRAFE